MAINGTFNIVSSSPMGKSEGSFTFKTEGDILTGTATANGETVDIYDGKVDGNDFSLLFKMKTPMGNLKIKVTGKVDGDNISGVFKYILGTMKFEGKRV